MRELYKVSFFERETGKLLKHFEYPVARVQNKYFWEKIKQEELQKLTKRLLVEPFDILVVDNSAVK